MSKENKRRPLVFTPPEEPAAPPKDPVVQPEEDIDVLLSETSTDADETPSVGPDTFEHSPEPEATSAPDVLPFGWRVLGLAQQTGAVFLVSAELNSEGVRAYWRKTRALSHNKWVLKGRWSDRLTNVDLIPQPRYYKEIP